MLQTEASNVNLTELLFSIFAKWRYYTPLKQRHLLVSCYVKSDQQTTNISNKVLGYCWDSDKLVSPQDYWQIQSGEVTLVEQTLHL